MGAAKGAVADDLAATVGNTGTAHAGLMLADALDRAKPDDLIAVVSLADGCDVTIWRATAGDREQKAGAHGGGADRLERSPHVRDVSDVAGLPAAEPPRRPDPERPAAAPCPRRAWKFAFMGSRCQPAALGTCRRSGCA